MSKPQSARHQREKILNSPFFPFYEAAKKYRNKKISAMFSAYRIGIKSYGDLSYTSKLLPHLYSLAIDL